MAIVKRVSFANCFVAGPQHFGRRISKYVFLVPLPRLAFHQNIHTSFKRYMMSLKKIIYLGMLVVFLAGIIFPIVNAKALSMGELTARVQVLKKQLETLQKQLEVQISGSAAKRLATDIRYGLRNDQNVRDLQQFLIERGYLKKGSATGNFLSHTREALQKFQNANGVPVTGVFDLKTREAAHGVLREGEKAKQEESVANAPTVRAAVSTTTTTTLKEPRSGHRIDPKPTYDLAAIERLAFDAVNAERQKNGLNALTWNDRIAAVARAHSADQATDNGVITDPNVACLYPFIRHEGFVTGLKVGDRLEHGGIPYRMAGENIIILPMTRGLIYRAETLEPECKQASDRDGMDGETEEGARRRVKALLDERIGLMGGQKKLDWINKEWKEIQEMANESAVDWMNSPGHRRIIVTPDFTESGMGAAVVNDYIILTQVFLKKP